MEAPVRGAQRGQRVREDTPAGHWRTLTLLGGLIADGHGGLDRYFGCVIGCG